MVVLITRNASPRLRGLLRRYLLEVDSGVFVGSVDARVREHLWEVACSEAGGALLAHPSQREQRFDVRCFGEWADRAPEDWEGFTVILRRRSGRKLAGRRHE